MIGAGTSPRRLIDAAPFASVRQSGGKAFPPSLRPSRLAVAAKGEAAETAFKQMLGGEPADGIIIGTDTRQAKRTLEITAEIDNRNFQMT